jgi:hypothetical protein
MGILRTRGLDVKAGAAKLKADRAAGALPVARFRARTSQPRQHRASIVRSDAYRLLRSRPQQSTVPAKSLCRMKVTWLRITAAGRKAIAE